MAVTPLDDTGFRYRLTEARQAQNLSMSDLARRLHVTPQAVHAWETGINVPRRRRIMEAAQVLTVSPRWLAFGEGNMHTNPDAGAAAPALLDHGALTEDLRAATVAWGLAVRDMLPERLRPYYGPEIDVAQCDYLSPTLIADWTLRSADTSDLLLYRPLVKLLVARAFVARGRPALMIIADREGVAPPRISSRLITEAGTLGVELVPVATPGEAAAAIQERER